MKLIFVEWIRFIIYFLLMHFFIAAEERTSEKCSDFSPSKALSSSLAKNMKISWILKKDYICILLESYSNLGEDGWMSFGLSRSFSMISNPPSNILLWKRNEFPKVYILTSQDLEGITLQETQSSSTVVSFTISENKTRILYWRSLNAHTFKDVSIDTKQGNFAIWALGKNWPEKHKKGEYGAIHVNFLSGDINFKSSFSVELILLLTSLCMLLILLLIGIIFKYCSFLRRKKSLHFLLSYRPFFNTFLYDKLNLVRDLIEMNMGEIFILFYYLVCILFLSFLAIILFSKKGSQGFSLQSLVMGNITILNLMFTLLPITRFNIYYFPFNTSFKNLIKFHRILAVITILLSIPHVYFSLHLCSSIFELESCGSRSSIPFYGFIGIICFTILYFLSFKWIQEQVFEVFYYSHRIFSPLLVLFVILHSKWNIYPLLVPIFFYLLGAIFRFFSYSNVFTTSSIRTIEDIAILEITGERIWKKEQIKVGAYCYICIPSISTLQWHPFTIISGYSKKNSIAFAIKKISNGSFTGQLYSSIENEKEIKVCLDGPHGFLNLKIENYETLVLVSGGIGITPMIGIINKIRDKNYRKRVFLIWVIKKKEYISLLEEYLFSNYKIRESIFYHIHVSRASEDGVYTISDELSLRYEQGYPDLPRLFNQAGEDKTTVGVVACGPQSLIQAASVLAKINSFDFCKEDFYV